MKIDNLIGSTCYTRNGKKLINYQMMGLKNVFKDDELVGVVNAMNKFKSSLDPNFPNLQSSLYDTNIGSDLLYNRKLKLYKYTHPSDIELYLKNGKIKLGSIDSFRKLENLKAKDQAEGLSNVVLNINGRDNLFQVSTGFNSYILCFTISKNSEYHLDTFGYGCYELADVIGFCEHLKVKLNAKRYYIRKVHYSDLKITRANGLKIKKFDSHIKDGNISELLFDEIYKTAFFPCLFVKPVAFKEEQEVRIVFELRADIEDVEYLTDLELVQFMQFK